MSKTYRFVERKGTDAEHIMFFIFCGTFMISLFFNSVVLALLSIPMMLILSIEIKVVEEETKWFPNKEASA